MLRQQFDQSLFDLQNLLLTMGKAVLEQLELLQETLPLKNVANYRHLIDQDALINAQEMAIEQKALQLIALQQPVSQDLRRVITALKASSDIERMGDHIRAIARELIGLSSSTKFGEMAEQIDTILSTLIPFISGVLKAFGKRDPDTAIHLSIADEQIDLACKNLKNQSVVYLQNNPEEGKQFLAIAIHLERLGDYARNLCEWVVYLEIGKFVNL